MGKSLREPKPTFSDLRKIFDRWTCQEIRWGIQHKMMSAPEVLPYAVKCLEEDSPLLEPLLDLATEDKYSLVLEQKINVICQAEGPESERDIKYVWRNVLLIWLFETEKDDKTLEQKVQLLCDDFGFPDDMRMLIPWMPLMPGEERPELPWNIRREFKRYLPKHPLPR